MQSLISALKGLLSDTEGASMMRLMSLVSLLCGCLIGVYGVIRGTDMTGVAALSSVFVGAAFAGKVAQKHVENK